MISKLTILCLTLAALLAPAPARVASAQTAASGSVIVWGGSAEDFTTPPDLGRVKAIARGFQHALALKADGTVVAWGSRFSGNLPVPPGLRGVKAIAAFRHSLALKADGTVIAWGANDLGQANVPAGLSNVTAIAAGANHSLALKADGTVVAWGANNEPPAGLEGVTAIAAGAQHSLALKEDGTIVGWGSNVVGQLNIPPGLTNVTAIAAGYFHSLALKNDGTVVAWGRSDDVLNVPADLNGVIAIAAGLTESLALKADGTVVGWGSASLAEAAATLRNVVALAAGSPSLALVTGPAPGTSLCAALCFRAPQYYITRLDQLPDGLIFISGNGLNNTISTDAASQMRAALDGGSSVQDRFNQQYAAAQLSLLAAPGLDVAALRSPLTCFNLAVSPVAVGPGRTLTVNSTLGDLLDAAREAARNNFPSTMEALARILAQLNGNDPQGRCSTQATPR